MAVRSAPFYWIECDVRGCSETCPTGDEISAWDSEDTAIDMARESGWLLVGNHEYCPEHHHELCWTCGRWLDGEEQDRGEYTCSMCDVTRAMLGG